MSNVGTWVSCLIISSILIWVVWRQPWPGLPSGWQLKVLKVAAVWVFIACAITVSFVSLDVRASIWRYLVGVTVIVEISVIIPMLFLAARRYERLKRNPDLPPIIEPANQKPIPPLFLKRSLTFRNKLNKNIMVMASRKADHDHPELVVLTALQKDETKLVEDAVLAGQRFYTIKAKDAMASESDRFLFSREFTEEELEKSNWTVVIEPWL